MTEALPSAAEAAAATGFACPGGQVLEFDRVRFFGLLLNVEGGQTIQNRHTYVSESVHGIDA